MDFKFTYATLLEDNKTEYYLRDSIDFLTSIFANTDIHMLIWDWHKTPVFLRKLCCYNGGDENQMIAIRKNDNTLMYGIPLWATHTDSCGDPDTYEVGDFVIIVGNH